MQLHIAEPCSQDWEGMQPEVGGRFCGSCQKTVIDFTQMSDAEMLSAITRAAGGCCGRFETHQLQRPLALHPRHRIPFRMPLLPAAAVLATWFLLSLPQEGHAQQKKTVTTQQTITKNTSDPLQNVVGEVMPLTVLSGRVMDGKMPLANVTVSLAGTAWQTKTDAKGQFSLQAPAVLNAQSHLLVKAVYYADKNVPIDPRHPDKFLQIQLVNTNAIKLGKVAAVPVPQPMDVTATRTMGAPVMVVKDSTRK